MNSRDYSRTDRIADLIQRELAQLIHRELRDPRLGMVTVSDLSVSPDLSNAKVYITVFNEIKSLETIEALNKAAGFLRSNLAKKLKLRATPKLSFYYDETLEKGNRISKLIDQGLGKGPVE